MKLLLITLTAFAINFSFAQNVGIGTTLPKARLHVADSAVVFTGPTNLPNIAGRPPVTGVGTRMMWYAAKGAFRAGGAIGDSWDEANTGRYSAAFNQSKAVGNNSFGAGGSTTALGNASAVLGISNTAQAMGSLVIGRLASTAGSTTDWIDNEDLFVIGNGYVDTINVIGLPPGYNSIKQNAMRVRKDGRTTFNGNVIANAGITVNENSIFNNELMVVENFSALTTSLFYGEAEFRDTIRIGNESIMSNNGGTVPNLDLVPICIYEFEIGVNRPAPPSFDNFYQSGTNIYGNLISTITNNSEAINTTINATVGGRLNFNTTIANRYTKIIAVPSVSFRGEGVSDDARLITIFSDVHYNASNKPDYFSVYYRTDDQPYIGNFYVKGTVMFYGLK
jgi:hypothetical protein